MRWTNRKNLPQPLVDAVKNDGYTRGDADYSITGLLKPARATALERIHDQEISVDVADRIFSLVGQVVHGILERAERTAIAEKRFFANLGGKRISGGTDRLVLYGDGLLQDYKFVTLWKFMGGSLPPEYEAQVNGYYWLLHENGINVRRLELLALYRDWNKSKAFRDAGTGYPEAGVEIFDVPIWPIERTKEFFEARILAHEAAKSDLPLCSDEERWSEGPQWAVYKAGSKTSRAVRVYATEQEAREHIEKFGEGYRMQFRQGESKRCPLYCLAAPFCSQWKAIEESSNDKRSAT